MNTNHATIQCKLLSQMTMDAMDLYKIDGEFTVVG